MSQDQPSRQRKTSKLLFVTFVLGICIGFSVAYALFDSLQWNFAKAPVETAPPSPVSEPKAQEPLAAEAPSALPTPSDQTPPEVPSVQPETSFPADTKALWPARHLFVSIPGATLDDTTRSLLSEFKPGGVVLHAENAVDEAQTRELAKQIKEAVGLGVDVSSTPLVAIAQEGGPILNLLHLDPAPSAEELGQKNDPAEVRRVARTYAEAARNRDIGVILAPVLDVFVPGLSNPEIEEPDLWRHTEESG